MQQDKLQDKGPRFHMQTQRGVVGQPNLACPVPVHASSSAERDPAWVNPCPVYQRLPSRRLPHGANGRCVATPQPQGPTDHPTPISLAEDLGT